MKINIFIFYLVVILASCKKQYSLFQKVETTYLDNQSKGEYRWKIDDAYTFTRHFIDSYRETSKEYGLDNRFYDSVSFMLDKNVCVDFCFSTTHGVIIGFYKHPQNRFTILGSDWPAQTYLLQPAFLANQRTLFDSRLFLHRYEATKAKDSLARSVAITFFNYTLAGQYKFVGIDTSMLAVFNTRIVTLDEQFNPINSIGYNFALISGRTGVAEFIDRAKELGAYYANFELQQQFFKSEFFRQLLANEKLYPFAREIELKNERRQMNKDYSDYSKIEFLHDKKWLQSKIDSFNVKLSADDMLDNASSHLSVGVLFFSYSTYWEFVYQWIAINMILLLVSAAVILWKHELLEYVWGSRTSKDIFLTTCLFVNGYCFYNKPSGMSATYWFPTLSIVILALMLYKPKTSS